MTKQINKVSKSDCAEAIDYLFTAGYARDDYDKDTIQRYFKKSS